MHRRTIPFLFAAALASPGLPQPKADTAATIKGLEEKWAAAQVRGDAATMEGLLGDAFVYTTIDGVVRNKAQTIAEIKSGKLKIQAAKVDEIKVTLYGETAVAIGRWQGKGIEDGKPFEDVERWTDTWVRIKGQWRCVASQSTLVKE